MTSLKRNRGSGYW